MDVQVTQITHVRTLERFSRECSVWETGKQVPLGSPDLPQPLHVRAMRSKPAGRSKLQAFALFREGRSIEHVMQALGRAHSTTMGYLAEFIVAQKPATIERWIDAAATLEERRLSPIFERLDGRVPYDAIRLVLAHIEAMNAVGEMAAGQSI